MWNRYASSPVLWKKVDVKFFQYDIFENKTVLFFSRRLSSSVTYMKLDFDFYCWEKRLNFEVLCLKLNQRCPQLHTLILHHAFFPISLSSVINLCCKYFPNLKILILTCSTFDKNCREREYIGHPKLEVLDLSLCKSLGRSSANSFSKMPCLKKLNLFRAQVKNYWFWPVNEVSYLKQLETLHLGNMNISYRTFRTLQNYAINLTELFLCWAELNDDYFSFNNSVFPLLKTVCLRQSKGITCEGILSLIQSCQTLQNVYVDEEMAESYTNHPLVTANISEVRIVKCINKCNHDTIFFA